MNKIQLTSAGGLGDSLIILSKILQKYHIEQWPSIDLNHYEKHECNIQAIGQVLGRFINGKCHLVKHPKEEVKKEESEGAAYINTVIHEMESPYFPSGLIEQKKLTDKEQIVIVSNAGRNDSTRRIVSDRIVYGLADFFPNSQVVLVGTENRSVKYDKIINLTGKISNVWNLIEIIAGSKMTIGTDGFCCYASAMFGKKTIVQYHLDNLINHYYNIKWSSHVFVNNSPDNILDHLQMSDSELRSFYG